MQQNWRKYDEEGTVKMALNYEQELARQKGGNCRQWEQHGQRATDQEKIHLLCSFKRSSVFVTSMQDFQLEKQFLNKRN